MAEPHVQDGDDPAAEGGGKPRPSLRVVGRTLRVERGVGDAAETESIAARGVRRRVRRVLGHDMHEGTTTVFADDPAAAATMDVLKRHAATTGVRLFAWCVMPDHVHLVIAPSATCDVVTFVGQFKNLAQRECWAIGVVGTFWQRSFWDRALHSPEKVDSAIRYVLNNPIRAGIIDVNSAYRHSGVAPGLLPIQKAA